MRGSRKITVNAPSPSTECGEWDVTHLVVKIYKTQLLQIS